MSVSRNISHHVLMLWGICCGFSVAPLQAADDRIEEVLITSNYHANNNTPVSFQNISSDEIETLNYGQEPSFILTRTPSITAYSDSGAYQGYSYFRLRGMDQTRVNMTLNGVPLNEPEDQGVYFSNYPDFFDSLDNVQIQRGIGTSKNGTASYAGSIQFTSPDLKRDEQSRLEIGGGDFGNARIMGEYYSGMEEGRGFYIRASSVHSDGYKHRSENDSQSLFFSYDLNTIENHEIKVTSFIGHQKNELAWLGVPQTQIDSDRRTNANSKEDDQFKQGLLIINHDFRINDTTELNSGAYYNKLRGDYDFDLNNFIGLGSTDELFNYAVSSDFYGLFSSIKTSANDLQFTAGVHTNHYSRTHKGSEASLGTLYENEGFRDEYSVFSKFDYQLERTSLFINLQYRHTSFDYDGSIDFKDLDWSFFNPMAGISFRITPTLTTYYSVGRTSREPTRTDIFGGNDNLELDELERPSIFITDEESVIDHELGARFISRKASGSINLYYMDFDDEITLNGQFGPNGLALNEDVDKSFRSGVEATLDIKLSDALHINNSIAWSYNRIKDEGEKFEPILSPDWVIFQEWVYIENAFKTSVSWHYQNDAYMDFSNTEKLDGFVLANIMTSYRWSNVEVQFRINNLFDKDYHASGFVDADNTNKYFVGAPRNYQALIRVTF